MNISRTTVTPSRHRIATTLAVLVSTVAVGLAATAPADAALYWGDGHAQPDSGINGGQPGWGAVGRAALDGSSPLRAFVFSDAQSGGVAVDATSIYVPLSDGEGRDAPSAPGAIGRTPLDGTGPVKRIAAGDYAPVAVAVDGAHVYWADRDAGKIGRADLDGGNVTTDFITGAHGPEAVVVDGAHVYWTNGATGTIGRAALDGTGAVQDLVTGASRPVGLAVDGAHLYWANAKTGTIGRAALDGTSPVQSFITGAIDPQGVAVDGAHVYWSNHTTAKVGRDTIGRAGLDGTAVTQNLVSGLRSPSLLAVDDRPVAAPPARLKVSVSAPRQSARTIARDGIVARVTFNQPGDVLMAATVSASTARALHLRVRKGARTVQIGVPGEAYDTPDHRVTAYPANLRPAQYLVLTPAAARALRHAHGIRITLVAKAATEGGLTATARRVITAR